MPFNPKRFQAHETLIPFIHLAHPLSEKRQQPTTTRRPSKSDRLLKWKSIKSKYLIEWKLNGLIADWIGLDDWIATHCASTA